jgi:hypothetical protein
MIPQRGLHSIQDIFTLGPGPAQELGEETALARDDGLTIDHDVELTLPPLLKLDRYSQFIPDQGGETRRVRRSRRSGLAVDDSDAHCQRS